MPQRDERDGIAILVALASALGGSLAYDDPAAVMAELARATTGYVTYEELERTPGLVRALPSSQSLAANVQAVAPAPPPTTEGLSIITGRSLYTSWAGASIHSDEADKLHREEAALLHPRDAEAIGARDGDQATLSDGVNELRIRIKLDDGVAPGSVYVPHYYDGGALMRLLPPGGATASTTLRLRALQPA
jgi:predicted molibdopterin-dependent oxidoreductase YjgC